MTNLAQLHDCHSCYDERSIDQKKKNPHDNRAMNGYGAVNRLCRQVLGL